jgi:hypothetical protein
MEFYFMGDSAKSHRYYRLLKDYYKEHADRFEGHVPEMGTFDDFLRVGLQEYVGDMTFQQARTVVRGYLTQAMYCWASNADDRAASLEREAEEFAKEWNITNVALRESVRVDTIREATIVEFLTRAARTLAPELLENLKKRLGREKVEAIIANVEGSAAGVVGSEEIDEELRSDPTRDISELLERAQEEAPEEE